MLSNIEILDALTYADGAGYANGVPIYQLQNTGFAAGSTGSTAITNCYFHDCQLGIHGSGTTVGVGSFVHCYDSEFYRLGEQSALTHNIYVPGMDEFIMMNCYSHLTNDVHLVKTRARSNFIVANRITGERTDFSDPDESCCIDVSNGGLTYVIGNQIAQFTRPTWQSITVQRGQSIPLRKST